MSELSNEIVSALEKLKAQEIITASSNALKIRAWLYLMRFLSSFNNLYDKKNAHSSIELSSDQASLFAFGIDENNSQNFLFFCQESDYWWISEIGIDSAFFADDFLVLKFPPINYENLNITSHNKIAIKSLTVSIPLSPMYIDYLKQYSKDFKRLIIGKIQKNNSGFNKLEVLEYSKTPVKIVQKSTILTKQFHLKNRSAI